MLLALFIYKQLLTEKLNAEPCYYKQIARAQSSAEQRRAVLLRQIASKSLAICALITIGSSLNFLLATILLMQQHLLSTPFALAYSFGPYSLASIYSSTLGPCLQPPRQQGPLAIRLLLGLLTIAVIVALVVVLPLQP